MAVLGHRQPQRQQHLAPTGWDSRIVRRRRGAPAGRPTAGGNEAGAGTTARLVYPSCRWSAGGQQEQTRDPGGARSGLRPLICRNRQQRGGPVI